MGFNSAFKGLKIGEELVVEYFNLDGLGKIE